MEPLAPAASSTGEGAAPHSVESAQLIEVHRAMEQMSMDIHQRISIHEQETVALKSAAQQLQLINGDLLAETKRLIIENDDVKKRLQDKARKEEEEEAKEKEKTRKEKEEEKRKGERAQREEEKARG